MILRAPEYSDLDLLFELENDPLQWITSYTRAPFSRAALKQFIVRSAQYDIFALRQQRFIIELGDEGKKAAIGFVDLTDFSPEHHRAEVGLLLLPAYRGQGYGKKALQLLETYASDALSLHNLYAFVAVDNIASQRLFQTAVYEDVGLLSDWFFFGGVYRDAHFFKKTLVFFGNAEKNA